MNGLIIGLGSIAQKHIKAIQTLNQNINLYALRLSKNPSSIDSITNLFSYEQAHKINPDFIIISNPTFLHKDSIKKVLKWKKPLFIEKPVFSSLDGAETIIEYIEKNTILTYVGCNLRFLGCLIFLNNYIKGKRINEVNVYCGSYLPNWRVNTDFRKLYSANKELGGGVHLDCIHELDYVKWLFGVPKKVNAFFKSTSSLNISAVDFSTYLLEYPQFYVNITLNYFRKNYKRTIEILLPTETILVDLFKNKITNDAGIILFESKERIFDTYFSQMQYFIDLVTKRKKESINSLGNGIEVLKICLNEFK